MVFEVEVVLLLVDVTTGVLEANSKPAVVEGEEVLVVVEDVELEIDSTASLGSRKGRSLSKKGFEKGFRKTYYRPSLPRHLPTPFEVYHRSLQ